MLSILEAVSVVVIVSLSIMILYQMWEKKKLYIEVKKVYIDRVNQYTDVLFQKMFEQLKGVPGKFDLAEEERDTFQRSLGSIYSRAKVQSFHYVTPSLLNTALLDVQTLLTRVLGDNKTTQVNKILYVAECLGEYYKKFDNDDVSVILKIISGHNNGFEQNYQNGISLIERFYEVQEGSREEKQSEESVASYCGSGDR